MANAALHESYMTASVSGAIYYRITLFELKMNLFAKQNLYI